MGTGTQGKSGHRGAGLVVFFLPIDTQKTSYWPSPQQTKVTFEAPGRQTWQERHFRVNIKKLLQVRCWVGVKSIAGDSNPLGGCLVCALITFFRRIVQFFPLLYCSGGTWEQEAAVGLKERSFPRFGVESPDLFQPTSAHAVMRTSFSHMSLCFLLLFFYIKNGLLK